MLTHRLLASFSPQKAYIYSKLHIQVSDLNLERKGRGKAE